MNRFERDCKTKAEFLDVVTILSEKAFHKPKEEFKPVTIIVEKMKMSVTGRQQRYLFGVVYRTLLEGLIDSGDEYYKGMNIDDFDMEMRVIFYYRNREKDGKIEKIPKRLSFGNGEKSEVKDYIDKLIMTASKIGITIPEPEDGLFNKKEKTNEQ